MFFLLSFSSKFYLILFSQTSLPILALSTLRHDFHQLILGTSLNTCYMPATRLCSNNTIFQGISPTTAQCVFVCDIYEINFCTDMNGTKILSDTSYFLHNCKITIVFTVPGNIHEAQMSRCTLPHPNLEPSTWKSKLLQLQPNFSMTLNNVLFKPIPLSQHMRFSQRLQVF
jgi:hypothetical protein